ncbi:hypothetical protein JL722_9751 [Aureococcus anophagefferens]|nr:hypothetical protein JL722_9751 [Aureococcus anophagefferens]
MVLRRGRRRRYVARLGVCLALLVAACAGRSRTSAAARARRARVAPGGSALLLFVHFEDEVAGGRRQAWAARREASRLAALLAAHGGGRVAVAGTGLDYYEKRRDLALGGAAAFVAVGGAVNATSRPRYDEARARNAALRRAGPRGAGGLRIAGVVFASARAACLGAGGRGLFFRFAPKGIDDRYEQTCDGALRPPSQPAPRDNWSGDLVPRVGGAPKAAHGGAPVWPALVFSCWSPLTAVNAWHLFGELSLDDDAARGFRPAAVPALKFRVAVRHMGECDAPAPVMLVLDVHRRVQSSIYGGKAVVIYDGAAAVAPAPDGGAALGRRRAPLAPNRSDAALRLFGDFPAAAPKHVRCCGEEEDPGGCVWRPTLLERTEGSGTAEALERAAAQQEAAVLRGEASWIERREGKKEEPSSRDAKNLRSAILEEIVRRREVEIAALKNAEADPLYVADLGDDDGAKRLKAEAKAAFTRIVTLPKVIPANATAPWASAIPRVIFQTFRSRSVPFRLHEAVMSWSRANPAYEHRIFDDDDMGAFVVETFGWDSREIRALNAAPRRCEIDHGFGDRLVVALGGPPRFDVSQWAFAAPPGHRVLAAAAALAVDNLLRSSGNLPRKRGAKKAGAFPKNFTARPPNVVPVFRGLRRVFREDPPAALAASEPALAAAAARDRETEGGYDVEARWECPVANVNQIGDEGLAGPPVLQAALEAVAYADAGVGAKLKLPTVLLSSDERLQFARKDGSPDPAVARATANRPLSLAERFAVRAAFRELVSLRPPEFGRAINSKYADEQSYKDDLATAGVKHWSDAWAEYDMGIYNILNPQTPPTPNPTPEVPETPAPTPPSSTAADAAAKVEALWAPASATTSSLRLALSNVEVALTLLRERGRYFVAAEECAGLLRAAPPEDDNGRDAYTTALTRCVEARAFLAERTSSFAGAKDELRRVDAVLAAALDGVRAALAARADRFGDAALLRDGKWRAAAADDDARAWLWGACAVVAGAADDDDDARNSDDDDAPDHLEPLRTATTGGRAVDALRGADAAAGDGSRTATRSRSRRRRGLRAAPARAADARGL